MISDIDLNEMRKMQARIEELQEAIVWALGYTDFQEPTPSTYTGQYWWRTELRKRSGLTHEQAQEISLRMYPAEQEMP